MIRSVCGEDAAPPPQACTHQLASVLQGQGLGTGEGQRGAEALALGALREGEGSARVALSAITEREACAYLGCGIVHLNTWQMAGM